MEKKKKNEIMRCALLRAVQQKRGGKRLDGSQCSASIPPVGRNCTVARTEIAGGDGGIPGSAAGARLRR